MSSIALLAAARIAHSAPGRLRLRFDRNVDVAEVAMRIMAELTRVGGNVAVEPRSAARSVIIRYDAPELRAGFLLEDMLSRAGVQVQWPKEAARQRSGGTAVGTAFVKSVGRANSGLEKATGGAFGLAEVFPLSLLALGIRRVMQGELQAVPWYNLLYYGYSVFYTTHRSGGERQPDAMEILRRRYNNGIFIKNF